MEYEKRSESQYYRSEIMRFVIPFYYLFKSRLPKRSEKISWFFVNPIPLFIVAYMVGNMPVWNHAVFFALGFLAWQCIYEIGYIENDVFTIRREAEPNIRLSDADTRIAERGFRKIVLFRLLVAAIALLGLAGLAHRWNAEVWIGGFIGLLALSRVAFVAHNKIRSRLNIFTYGVLSVIKYSFLPLLLCADGNGILAFVIAVTMFPLVRTVEHAAKQKYTLECLQVKIKDLSSFRTMYYFAGFFLACTAYWILRDQGLFYIIIIFAYYLAYRSTIWVLVNKGIVTPTARTKN